MDRRQGEAKKSGVGGGFGFGYSKPHKELLPPLSGGDTTSTGKGGHAQEMLLQVSHAEGARTGFRASEGSSGCRGAGGEAVEDEKKRRLSPPSLTPPPAPYASPASAAAVRRDGAGVTTAAAVGGGSAPGVSASSQQPCCQAEKCTADLAEAKRYHRRHKVCETHAKAAAVVVAGLRQRFCQQCSRFHELSEFDDTKRSCRRRLVCHNERRRKSSGDSQEEGSNNRCRQTDPHRKIQITMPGAAAAAAATPAYKHFQTR